MGKLRYLLVEASDLVQSHITAYRVFVQTVQVGTCGALALDPMLRLRGYVDLGG